eukprot:6351435-Ditylum_brightwellii.AAC.1
MKCWKNGSGKQLRQQPESEKEDNDSNSDKDFIDSKDSYEEEAEPNIAVYNHHPMDSGGMAF